LPGYGHQHPVMVIFARLPYRPILAHHTLIHRRAWKVNSENFACTECSEGCGYGMPPSPTTPILLFVAV
jgi:hypothetical protein